MENYIESRVFLGLLCLIHVFVIYAAQAPWGRIRSKVLNSIIITELIAVTAYILYDNLQLPPYDGWFAAILGYIFVYALILITWISYSIFTALEEDKTYEMTITHHIRFMNQDYFEGIVMDGNRKVIVILPYSSEKYYMIANSRTQKVKFAEVLRGMHIVVKLA